ncbi:hypothetical protein AB0Q93_35340, partial [Streptomyces sp. NPDC088184]
MSAAQQTIQVGGEWRPALSGATRDIIDPVDAGVFAVVSEGGVADTDDAVAAARAAFDDGVWPRTPVAQTFAPGRLPMVAPGGVNLRKKLV